MLKLFILQNIRTILRRDKMSLLFFGFLFPIVFLLNDSANLLYRQCVVVFSYIVVLNSFLGYGFDSESLFFDGMLVFRKKCLVKFFYLRFILCVCCLCMIFGIQYYIEITNGFSLNVLFIFLYSIIELLPIFSLSFITSQRRWDICRKQSESRYFQKFSWVVVLEIIAILLEILILFFLNPEVEISKMVIVLIVLSGIFLKYFLPNIAIKHFWRNRYKISSSFRGQ